MNLEALSRVVKDLALPYSTKKIKRTIYLPHKRVISDIHSLVINNKNLTYKYCRRAGVPWGQPYLNHLKNEHEMFVNLAEMHPKTHSFM